MCDECIRCHRKSSGRTRSPEFSLAFSTHRACLSANVAKGADAADAADAAEAAAAAEAATDGIEAADAADATDAAIDVVEAAGPETGMVAAGDSGGNLLFLRPRQAELSLCNCCRPIIAATIIRCCIKVVLH